MCLLLLPGAADRRGEAPLVTWLKRRYRARLPRFVANPRWSLIGLAGAIAVAGLSAFFLGEEFMPKFKETDFLMHWVERPGTSLEAMDRVTVLASKELRKVPGVRNFGSHIGRAEVADEIYGPEFTELWISVDEEADYDSTVAKIQEVVDGYPGLYRDVLTYLKERIKEVLTGASSTLVVRIFGPDLATLRAKAEEIYAAIRDIEGVVEPKVEPQKLVPHVEVRFLPEAAERFGLTAGANAYPEEVARRIDHTLLKADATREQIEKLCGEARQYGFATVCVNPTWVAACADLLRGSATRVCTVAGFPLGATPPEVKAYETARVIADGACEVDMVLNVGALKSGDYRLVERDIALVADACRRARDCSAIWTTRVASCC